jgi:hypothetical protein
MLAAAYRNSLAFRFNSIGRMTQMCSMGSAQFPAAVPSLEIGTGAEGQNPWSVMSEIIKSDNSRKSGSCSMYVTDFDLEFNIDLNF